MIVTLEQFQKNPGVPVGIAAIRLGIGRCRVQQLLLAGKLESYWFEGQRFVSVASILARQKLQRAQRRK